MAKKFLPGKYEIPGGRIDYGEDIEIGLIREIKEELGVDVILGDSFAVFTYTNDIKAPILLKLFTLPYSSGIWKVSMLNRTIIQHSDGLARMRRSN